MIVAFFEAGQALESPQVLVVLSIQEAWVKWEDCWILDCNLERQGLICFERYSVFWLVADWMSLTSVLNPAGLSELRTLIVGVSDLEEGC